MEIHYDEAGLKIDAVFTLARALDAKDTEETVLAFLAKYFLHNCKGTQEEELKRLSKDAEIYLRFVHKDWFETLEVQYMYTPPATSAKTDQPVKKKRFGARKRKPSEILDENGPCGIYIRSTFTLKGLPTDEARIKTLVHTRLVGFFNMHGGEGLTEYQLDLLAKSAEKLLEDSCSREIEAPEVKFSYSLEGVQDKYKPFREDDAAKDNTFTVHAARVRVKILLEDRDEIDDVYQFLESQGVTVHKLDGPQDLMLICDTLLVAADHLRNIRGKFHVVDATFQPIERS